MPASLQLTIGWFLVVFPSVCAVCFFAVLFFRPKNFYGPGDFRSDDSFITLNRQVAASAVEIESRAKESSARLETPTKATLEAIINHQDKRAFWYLTRVANTPFTFDEHLEMLGRE